MHAFRIDTLPPTQHEALDYDTHFIGIAFGRYVGESTAAEPPAADAARWVLAIDLVADLAGRSHNLTHTPHKGGEKPADPAPHAPAPTPTPAPAPAHHHDSAGAEDEKGSGRPAPPQPPQPSQRPSASVRPPVPSPAPKSAPQPPSAPPAAAEPLPPLPLPPNKPALPPAPAAAGRPSVAARPLPAPKPAPTQLHAHDDPPAHSEHKPPGDDTSHPTPPPKPAQPPAPRPPLPASKPVAAHEPAKTLPARPSAPPSAASSRSATDDEPLPPPQLSRRGDKPAGYNMSWFCLHSMAPLPDGCAECGLPPPQASRPAKPPAPSPVPKPKPSIPSRPSAPVSEEHKTPPPKPLPPAQRKHEDDGEEHHHETPHANKLPPPKPTPPLGRTPSVSRPPPPKAAEPKDDQSAHNDAETPQRPPPPKVSPAKPPRPEAPQLSSAHAEEDSTKPARPVPPKIPAAPSAAPSASGSGKPARPVAPTKAEKLEPPPLPPRPTSGHPLYHYMVTGPRATVLFGWKGEHSGELTLKEGDIVRLKRWVSPEWLEGAIDDRSGMFPCVFVDIEEDVELTGPRCVALFDFVPMAEHELSFGEGEELKLLGCIDEDWFRGEYRGQVGAFPANVVEVIEDLPDGPFEGWPEGWVPPDTTEDTSIGASEDPVPAAKHEAAAAPPAAEAPKPVARPSVPEVAAPIPTPKPAVRVPESQKKIEPPKHEDPGASPSGGAVPKTQAWKSMHASKPIATALFDFEAQTPYELSFSAEQAIFLVREVDHEWFEGRIGDKTGIFPKNFVEVVVPLGEYHPGIELPPHPHPHHEEASKPAPATAAAPAKQTEAPQKTANPAASMPTAQPSGNGAVQWKARALQDHQPSHPDDLTLFEGEFITLIEKIDEHWYRAEVDKKQGLVPAAFIEILSGPGAPGQENAPTPAPHSASAPLSVTKSASSASAAPATPAPAALAGPVASAGPKKKEEPKWKARALHDYVPTHSEDLALFEGEFVTILEKVGDDWYKGQVDKKQGMFPAAYVEILVGPGSSENAAFANATHDYVSDHEGDLNFVTGDKIILLERVDADWLKGQCKGRIGLFPASFVNVVKDL